jgi:hypothetical protein
VTLTGTLVAGDQILISFGSGGVVRQVSPVVIGTSWSYTLVDADYVALGEGVGKTLTVSATDIAGNVSTLTRAVDVVTTPLAAPATPDLDTASDTGSSNTDNRTSDTTPTLTIALPSTGGRLPVTGDKVEIVDADGKIFATTTLSSASGSVSLTLGEVTPLADGAYTLYSRITDTYGNSVLSASALTITIDNRAPGAPGAPDMLAQSDSGLSTTDNITKILRPSFGIDLTGVLISSESLLAGDLIQLVRISGGTESVLESFALPNGFDASSAQPFTVTLSSDLAAGSYTIVTRAVKAANASLMSPSSPTLTFVIDNVASSAVSPTMLTADDLGASSTDAVTRITAPSFVIDLKDAEKEIDKYRSANLRSNLGDLVHTSEVSGVVVRSVVLPDEVGPEMTIVFFSDTAQDRYSACSAVSILV